MNCTNRPLLLAILVANLAGCRSAQSVGESIAGAGLWAAGQVVKNWLDPASDVDSRILDRKGITPGSKEHKQLRQELHMASEMDAQQPCGY